MKRGEELKGDTREKGEEILITRPEKEEIGDQGQHNGDGKKKRKG